MRWRFLADDLVDLGWFWGMAGEPLAPRTGGDAFEDDGEPALPEVGSRAFRCANDWVDQDGYDGKVAGVYVWVEATGGVRSCDELGHDWQDALPSAAGELGAAAVAEEVLPETAVCGLLFEVALHEFADAFPGILDLHGGLRGFDDQVYLLVKELIEQFPEGWEAAIDRPNSEAGLAGDLVVTDVEASVADHGAGGVEDALAIVLGVAAQERSSVKSAVR